MAWKKDTEFKYEVIGIDKVIEEKGNTMLALREVSWNDRTPSLELRKWRNTDEGERADKGFSFLTEDGPNELVNALIDCGFGNTQDILKRVSNREDFIPSMSDILGETITSEQLERFKNTIVKYNAEDLSDVYDPRDMDLD